LVDKDTYCKLLLEGLEPGLPCLDDLLSEFGPVRYVGLLEVFSQKEEKISKFAALNDIDRLWDKTH
jgi:hypothetical protein